LTKGFCLIQNQLSNLLAGSFEILTTENGRRKAGKGRQIMDNENPKFLLMVYLFTGFAQAMLCLFV
jgi:hypothetical protein